jgi:hypothetical protein
MKGCHVNLTIDHWMSKQNVNYVGLTAHWIDDDWNLHSLPLGMFLHEGGTTANAVFEKLLVDVSREISEVATVFAITADTDAAMNLLGILLEKHDIMHLCCTDHVFHLTCKLCYENSSFGDGIEVNAVQKATNIVLYFNKSTQAVEKIKQTQTLLEIYEGNTPVKPLTDVVTHWWSTYQMCNRIKYLKQALGSMFGGGDLPANLQLNEDEWDSLTSVITILKPFRSSQQLLEREKYVTSHYVLPTVFLCREGLRKGQLPGVPDSIRHLSKVLGRDFDARWGASTDLVFTGSVVRGQRQHQRGIHPAFVIATFLHPSLKSFTSMGMDNQSKANIETEVLKLMLEQSPALEGGGVEENGFNDDGGGDGPLHDNETPIARILRLNAEAQGTTYNETNTDVKASCERELLDHKKTNPKVLNHGKQYPDCLEWWKRNESRFPQLAVLAKKYLSIQATSAPSERIFSKAGRIISTLRTRLNSAIAGKLLYVSENWNWFLSQTQSESDNE